MIHDSRIGFYDSSSITDLCPGENPALLLICVLGRIQLYYWSVSWGESSSITDLCPGEDPALLLICVLGRIQLYYW
jgi:hypothetical protein